MATNNEKEWWYNLDKIWKLEFLTNVLSKEERQHLSGADIIEKFEHSEKTITDIVNIERIKIPRSLIYDLSPIFQLKRLNDFYIDHEYLYFNDEFVYIYPIQLRSKVRFLNLDGGHFDGNFSTLNSFVNVEELRCQQCRINSLDGIERFKKLKKLSVDQNSITSLDPLKSMKLTYLDISENKITDISVLSEMTSLEEIGLFNLKLNDVTPLFNLPNLKKVYCQIFDSDDIDEVNRQFKQLMEINKKIEYDFWI